MASAQVLANSRKDHLEAGKKRLEEFRKKKAAEKTKKAIPTGQVFSSDAGHKEKQTSESMRVGITNCDGAGTSDVSDMTVAETTWPVPGNVMKGTESVQNNGIDSSNERPVDHLLSDDNYRSNSVVLFNTALKNNDGLKFTGNDKENYDFSNYTKASESTGSDVTTYQSTIFRPSSNLDIERTVDGASGYSALNEVLSNDNRSQLKDFSLMNHVNFDSLVTNASTATSGSSPMFEKLVYFNNLAGSPGIYINDDSIPPIINLTKSAGQDVQSTNPPKFNNSMTSAGDLEIKNSLPIWLSESRHTAVNLDVGNDNNYVALSPTLTGINSKRSRPSFLESINVPRISSTSTPLFPIANSNSSTSIISPVNYSSLAFPNSMRSSVSNVDKGDLLSNGTLGNMEDKNEFYLRKQNEDFAALEQHIEDLTQEKFSLQRALEAARALAESLAAENSTLTETYNQQGGAVNQLKSDMEKLQEEIRTQLAELESVKIEYANAQLECNAADERAKLLASEVIGLEEKALRLRSSELKLERQLENSQAEIASLKKKMSSLGKERQDLQETIDALQEEKKLLQSKVRKSSPNGKLVDANKDFANKKDVSTTTEDLVISDDVEFSAEPLNSEMQTMVFGQGDASRFPMFHDHRQFEVSSSSIPPDQMRTIQNINTLMSELALEKEELMQSLSAQSSESSKLKELNKELTRKLEVQTQRLELLTSQTMITDAVSVREPDSDTTHDDITYADEGDEVVERVLGWIMKLFPGGPSKRRTSKLL